MVSDAHCVPLEYHAHLSAEEALFLISFFCRPHERASWGKDRLDDCSFGYLSSSRWKILWFQRGRSKKDVCLVFQYERRRPFCGANGGTRCWSMPAVTTISSTKKEKHGGSHFEFGAVLRRSEVLNFLVRFTKNHFLRKKWLPSLQTGKLIRADSILTSKWYGSAS